MPCAARDYLEAPRFRACAPRSRSGGCSRGRFLWISRFACFANHGGLMWLSCPGGSICLRSFFPSLPMAFWGREPLLGWHSFPCSFAAFFCCATFLLIFLIIFFFCLRRSFFIFFFSHFPTLGVTRPGNGKHSFRSLASLRASISERSR